jgi:uncharacterized iron-regulated membrane protein
MSFYQRWLHRPQSTWLRKAVFQVHLWAGMVLGLYIAVVCASGSAVVFRNDLYDVLEARSAAGGAGVQISYRILRWMSDLHGNLFLGSDGMMANAIGGFLTAGVCLTGLVIWWPGMAKWRRAVAIRGGVGWKRLIFDLHSAVGFWTFALVLMWGVTGGYFVFPQPFRAVIEYFTPINPPRLPQAPRVQPAPEAQLVQPAPGPATLTQRRRRAPLTLGQKILRGFSLAHYGSFAGWPVKALWVILGFAPTILFITAAMMWWNRVLGPALRRARANLSPQMDARVNASESD